MKKQLLKCSLLLLVVITLGCNSNSEKPTTEKELAPINNTPLTSLLVLNSLADKDIAFFDSVNRSLKMPIIKAYTIRAEELLAAMGIDSNLVKGKIAYNHIRVYPAYRENVGFKLYIYPVEGADLAKGIGGYDMVFDKYGRVSKRRSFQLMNKGTGNDGDDDYSLDLNAPCPNTCPQNN